MTRKEIRAEIARLKELIEKLYPSEPGPEPKPADAWRVEMVKRIEERYRGKSHPVWWWLPTYSKNPTLDDYDNPDWWDGEDQDH